MAAKSIAARFADGLSNVLSGLGTGRDKSIANRWTEFTAYSPMQIDAAYRASGFVRKAHDIPPEEMVKNWRRWELDAAKSELIEAEEKRLKARAVFLLGLRRARLLGGCGLVMGLPGDSADEAPKTIKKGELRYLIPFTRYELTFNDIRRDLEDPYFGLPEHYQLANAKDAAKIHPSRVIKLPGLPSTGLRLRNDLDDFWGHPLLESTNEPLMDAAAASRVVSALISDARQTVIGIPGLSELVSTAEGEALLSKRLQVVETSKGVFGVVLIDSGNGKEGEGDTWEERQIRFSSLDKAAMFVFQVAAGSVDIPLTRFLQTSASGLNSNGEGDEKDFIKKMVADQKMILRPALEQLDPYILGSAGVSDPKAVWTFNPLVELTAAEQADHDNVVADTYEIVKLTGLVQDDALAKTFVAALAESPNFSGIADAVAASPDDLPAKAAAEQAAAESAAIVNPPKPASLVGTNVRPRGGAGGSARRVAANDAAIEFEVSTPDLADLRDGGPRTLYVSRKVMNPQEVLSHFRGQGLDGLEAAGDLHVTVVYSTAPVDWMKLPSDWSGDRSGRLLIPPGGPRVLDLFGPMNETLVQAFASTDLGWRNAALLEAGCSSSWPDYTPHITIASDVPPDFDLSGLKPYTGRILLGPEIFEEVKQKAVVE